MQMTDQTDDNFDFENFVGLYPSFYNEESQEMTPEPIVIKLSNISQQKVLQFEPPTIQIPRIPTPEQHTSSNGPESAQQQDKFKWDLDSQLAFAKVVTICGVKGIKPREILKYMPQKYHLNSQQVGSHLQKYRIKLCKEYSLPSFDYIENWMIPKELHDQDLEKIANEWKQKTMDESHIEQLRSMIQ